MDYPRDKIEVIVIDDGSIDRTPVIVKGFRSVRYIRRERGGTASAQNVGIKASRGELLMIVDSDAYVAKYWLRKAVSEFGDPRVGIVGGCIKTAPTKSFWAKLAGYEAEDRCYRIESKYVDSMTTLGVVYRKEVIEEVGSFDEALSISGYDIDFARRAHKQGWKIVVRKDAACFHDWRNSLSSYIKQQVREGRSEIKLLKRDPTLIFGSQIHPKRLIMPTFLTGLIFLCIPISLLVGKWSITLPFIFYFCMVTWHIPLSARIVRRHREPLLIFLPFVIIVRYVAWLIGFLFELSAWVFKK